MQLPLRRDLGKELRRIGRSLSGRYEPLYNVAPKKTDMARDVNKVILCGNRVRI